MHALIRLSSSLLVQAYSHRWHVQWLPLDFKLRGESSANREQRSSRPDDVESDHDSADDAASSPHTMHMGAGAPRHQAARDTLSFNKRRESTARLNQQKAAQFLDRVSAQAPHTSAALVSPNARRAPAARVDADADIDVFDALLRVKPLISQRQHSAVQEDHQADSKHGDSDSSVTGDDGSAAAGQPRMHKPMTEGVSSPGAVSLRKRFLELLSLRKQTTDNTSTAEAAPPASSSSSSSSTSSSSQQP